MGSTPATAPTDVKRILTKMKKAGGKDVINEPPHSPRMVNAIAAMQKKMGMASKHYLDHHFVKGLDIIIGKFPTHFMGYGQFYCIGGHDGLSIWVEGYAKKKDGLERLYENAVAGMSKAEKAAFDKQAAPIWKAFWTVYDAFWKINETAIAACRDATALNNRSQKIKDIVDRADYIVANLKTVRKAEELHKAGFAVHGDMRKAIEIFRRDFGKLMQKQGR